MNNGPTYRGVLPRTDEHQERVLNACSLWSATEQVGMLRVVQVDSSGTVLSGMSIPTFDYVARVLTNATTETYTFRTGGSGGTVVATLVVVYTDSNLTTISSITKT